MGDFSFRNQWSPFKIDGKKWHRIGGFVSLQFVATACGPQFESFNPILFCTHFVSPSTMFACVARTPVLTHQACLLWRVVAWDEKMLLEEVVEEPVGPGVWRLLDDMPCTVECPLQVRGWFFFGYESYQIFYFLFFIPSSSNWTVFTALLFFIGLV